MFFKVIDKFFLQIKQILSFFTILLVGLSAITFLYWLLSCAKISLPGWYNDIVWTLCDLWALSYKYTPQYRQFHDLLPVITSIIIAIISYFSNCLIVFLENNHKNYHKVVQKYQSHVQDSVNKQLAAGFHSELRKSKLMLVKVKIISEQKTSYLNALQDENYDTNSISKSIEEKILASIATPCISQKGKTNDSIYFLINDLGNAKNFFTDIVEVSNSIINENLKPRLNINFYCGCELLNDNSELRVTEKFISRMFDLRLANKIIVTNKFKVFYENIYCNLFSFAVQGEYNLNEDSNSIKNSMLYTLQSGQ